jgi:hypothetical protein
MLVSPSWVWVAVKTRSSSKKQTPSSVARARCTITAHPSSRDR